MQLDFHTSHKQRIVPRQRTGPLIVLSLTLKRILGLSTAVIGVVFIVIALLSLTSTRTDSAYALLFFSRPDMSKPQSHVTIVWINEMKNSVQTTAVPDTLEFHSQTLGTYPIQSIFAAHQNTQQSETDFLTDLSFYLRFPIHAYAVSQGSVSASKLSLLRSTANSCISRRTTLTIGECTHLLLFFSSLGTVLRDLPFPTTVLGSSSVETIQPLDRTKYRDWSQLHFSESFAEWKKYTVAVLNGTQNSGLATTASAIIQDFGLTILYIGETRTPQAHGEIAIASSVQKNQKVVDFLKSTLRLPVRVDDELTTQYRSDVVVVIGESEKKFFTP